MQLRHLLSALVDLSKERLKNLLLQPLTLISLSNHLLNLTHALFLILLVNLLQLQLVIQFLNHLLVLAVLLAIVLIQSLALLRRGDLKSLVDQPRALVVKDIGADLANVLRVAEVVEVVVLDLEVLAERDEDSLALLQVLLSCDTELVESERDWEVEGIVCSLVDNNELVFLHAEVVQINLILWRSQEVAGLSQLGLEGDFMEELDEVDIRRVLAEVLLEEGVDCGFEHEGVVDGDHADAFLAVPTWGTAAGDGGVHDVVRDEEEGLEKLGHPAQSGGLEVFLLREVLAGENGDRVWDGHAAVTFSPDGVGIEVLHGVKVLF